MKIPNDKRKLYKCSTNTKRPNMRLIDNGLNSVQKNQSYEAGGEDLVRDVEKCCSLTRLYLSKHMRHTY